MNEVTRLDMTDDNINLDEYTDPHTANDFRKPYPFDDHEFVEITIEDTTVTPVIQSDEDTSFSIELCSEASSACNSECPVRSASRASDVYCGSSANTVSSSNNKFLSGSLSSAIGFWADITNDNFVLDLIKNGYKIPFFTTPTNNELTNNKRALNEREFLNKDNLSYCRVASQNLVSNHTL